MRAWGLGSAGIWTKDAAIGLALIWSGLGCLPTASGLTFSYTPGQPLRRNLIDLEHVGQPPPSAPQCLEGEVGCIETGWGPGWDLEKGREGQVTQHHRLRQRSQGLADRAIRRKQYEGGPCEIFWEEDSDVGSVPLGDCD